MIKKIKTTAGFEYEIETDNFNDFYFLDTVAEVQDGNPVALSKLTKIMFGDKQRKVLYKNFEDENGRVPIESIMAEVEEVFNLIGEEEKKLSPSPTL